MADSPPLSPDRNRALQAGMAAFGKPEHSPSFATTSQSAATSPFVAPHSGRKAQVLRETVARSKRQNLRYMVDEELISAQTQVMEDRLQLLHLKK